MKIINQTAYDTRGLRDVFIACAREVWRREKDRNTKPKNLRVTVKYHRGASWIGGYAWHNASSVVLKLPRPERLQRFTEPLAFERKIADVFIHELGHCIGIRGHRNGDKHDTHEHLYQDWIKEAIGEGFKVAVAVPKPKPDRKTIQAKRYEHAQKMLAKHQRNLNRTKTILKKWQRRVRYYERTLNT